MKGKLLFATVFALLAVTSVAAAQEPTAVYTFTCNGNASERIGNCPQGGRPDSLIQASDGNFYGAAQDSMEGSSSPTGGTVFKVTSAGTFTLLHTFLAGTNKNYPNGNLPGNIIQGPDGKLYGDTLFGGVDGCNGYCGYGLLYRINTNGTGFQILHKFCSQANCADGNAGYFLAKGTDGKIYGTTYYGGTGSAGTIFQITPSTGAYKVVFNFEFSTSGENPGALVAGPDGTFYGLSAGSGGEILFHYTESTGALTTTVLNFPLFNGLPSHGGDLTLGPNGNFYGLYGIYGMSGEGVFEVDVNGSNLQLFPFYTTVDGAGEPDGLLLASDGNFWMADITGNSYGNIITLSPADGSLIQTFTPFSSSAAVGAYPMEIIQARDGTLWGSTDSFGSASKGHFGDGTVFSFNVGLPPR
jgi:uncharacterized repeat protein (TIGR03803 family)